MKQVCYLQALDFSISVGRHAPMSGQTTTHFTFHPRRTWGESESADTRTALANEPGQSALFSAVALPATIPTLHPGLPADIGKEGVAEGMTQTIPPGLLSPPHPTSGQCQTGTHPFRVPVVIYERHDCDDVHT